MWIVSCVLKTALKPVPGIWLCPHRRVLCRTHITWRLNSQRRGPWYWNLPASAPKEFNSRVCLCYTDFFVPFPQKQHVSWKGEFVTWFLLSRNWLSLSSIFFSETFSFFKPDWLGLFLWFQAQGSFACRETEAEYEALSVVTLQACDGNRNKTSDP